MDCHGLPWSFNGFPSIQLLPSQTDHTILTQIKQKRLPSNCLICLGWKSCLTLFLWCKNVLSNLNWFFMGRGRLGYFLMFNKSCLRLMLSPWQEKYCLPLQHKAISHNLWTISKFNADWSISPHVICSVKCYVIKMTHTNLKKGRAAEQSKRVPLP